VQLALVRFDEGPRVRPRSIENAVVQNGERTLERDAVPILRWLSFMVPSVETPISEDGTVRRMSH